MGQESWKEKSVPYYYRRTSVHENCPRDLKMHQPKRQLILKLSGMQTQNLKQKYSTSGQVSGERFHFHVENN